MVSRNSLGERAFSLDSFDALLPDDSGEDDHIEVLILLHVLFNAEIQAIKLMRVCANDFVQVY